MPTPSTAKWPKPKSEDEFEDMVLDALKLRWKDPNADRNGRRGQRQDGVDVIGHGAHVQGRLVGAQCKNTDTLTLKDVVTEVEKARGFKPVLAEYLAVTSGDRDARLQEEVRLHFEADSAPFPVKLVFWEGVVQELAGRDDLVAKHWPGWTTPSGTDPPVASGEPEPGLSPPATAIVEYFVTHSETGTRHDPRPESEELRAALGMPEDEFGEAVGELEELSFVEKQELICGDPMVWPTDDLFAAFDDIWMSWSPAKDAIFVAKKLVRDHSDGIYLEQLAKLLDWPPRRLNPAVTVLRMYDAVQVAKSDSVIPYMQWCVWPNAATRRFLKKWETTA